MKGTYLVSIHSLSGSGHKLQITFIWFEGEPYRTHIRSSFLLPVEWSVFFSFRGATPVWRSVKWPCLLVSTSPECVRRTGNTQTHSHVPYSTTVISYAFSVWQTTFEVISEAETSGREKPFLRPKALFQKRTTGSFWRPCLWLEGEWHTTVSTHLNLNGYCVLAPHWTISLEEDHLNIGWVALSNNQSHPR